ncbi:hypothetical protein S245_043750, partial [Arachis hypogaea]
QRRWAEEGLIVVASRLISLDLGEKRPIIVFENVDLDKGHCLLKLDNQCIIQKAAEGTFFGYFWTNGQICIATFCLIVH